MSNLKIFRNAFLIGLTLFVHFYSYSQVSEEAGLAKEHHLFSKVLNEERGYWLSLPASYHRTQQEYRHYPVLVVLDGDAHFTTAASMVQFMGASQQIPEMIVVGIKNVNRRRDYSPDKIITVRKNDSGGGDNFLAFLEEELLPEIDKSYRTAPFRLLAGHSLGGLLSTHAYMKEHTIFNAFIALDPSLGAWDAETMDQKVATVGPASYKRVFYLASANSVNGKEKNEERHQRLFEALKTKSNESFLAKIEYFENETHRSLPLIGWFNGLRSVFEGYQYHYRNEGGLQALTDHYKKLSERLSFQFLPPESLVNRMGYNRLFSRDENIQKEALVFFQFNTASYPSSANAFDSLAEAFARLGDTESALENYKKALALNPENKHAAKQIQILSKK